MQSERDGLWRDYHAVRIPPRCGHAFQFRSQPAAFLFFDPGSVYFQRVFSDTSEPTPWTGTDATQAITAIHRLWQADDPEEKQITRELNQIPYAAPVHSIQEMYSDPRIRTVVQTILQWEDPDSAPGVDRLAKIAGLSPSRLAHLFQEQVGIPIRSLRTWFRLKAAAVSIRRGASLTDAALAAGFYDQAHFTHTFRDMFGLPPSQIFMPRDDRISWYIEAEELTTAIAADST